LELGGWKELLASRIVLFDSPVSFPALFGVCVPLAFTQGSLERRNDAICVEFQGELCLKQIVPKHIYMLAINGR
jgi:hypothetical protein